jgi:hypothetical protein
VTVKPYIQYITEFNEFLNTKKAIPKEEYECILKRIEVKGDQSLPQKIFISYYAQETPTIKRLLENQQSPYQFLGLAERIQSLGYTCMLCEATLIPQKSSYGTCEIQIDLLITS